MGGSEYYDNGGGGGDGGRSDGGIGGGGWVDVQPLPDMLHKITGKLTACSASGGSGYTLGRHVKCMGGVLGDMLGGEFEFKCGERRK